MMENSAFPPVANAAVFVRKMNHDDKMREIARTREEAQINEMTAIYAAEQHGSQLGSLNRTYEIAKKMLTKNMSLSDILELTGLTESDLADL
jgi:predicted transposase/invertase (TIGR01784 family)